METATRKHVTGTKPIIYHHPKFPRTKIIPSIIDYLPGRANIRADKAPISCRLQLLTCLACSDSKHWEQARHASGDRSEWCFPILHSPLSSPLPFSHSLRVPVPLAASSMIFLTGRTTGLQATLRAAPLGRWTRPAWRTGWWGCGERRREWGEEEKERHWWTIGSAYAAGNCLVQASVQRWSPILPSLTHGMMRLQGNN